MASGFDHCMPAMQPFSPTFDNFLYLNSIDTPPHASDAGEEHYDEPPSAESYVYSSEISDISLLIPFDQISLLDITSPTVPSAQTTMQEGVGGEEYDGDDDEDEDDRAAAMGDLKEIEAIRYFSSRRVRDREEYPARALPRYREVPNGSCCAPINVAAANQVADAKPVEASRLVHSINTPPPTCSTSEYSGHIEGSISHYPEASELFAVDYHTGIFKNPFHSSTGPDRSPLPLERPDAHGLAKNWNFSPAQPASPLVSPLSGYSSFVDDGIAVSPLSSPSRFKRRESAVFGHTGTGALIFSPIFDEFSSLPPSSSLSSPSRDTPLAVNELIVQLDEVVFEAAAHGFFAGFDVEGLFLDRDSSAFVLEDRDRFHDESERAILDWTPHEPRLLGHYWSCAGCQVAVDEETYRAHDFEEHCWCVIRPSFQAERELQEVRRQEEDRNRNKELEESRERERKRKRQGEESRSKTSSRNQEKEDRHVLHLDIRKVKEALAAEEDKVTDESLRAFHDEEGQRFASPGRSQLRGAENDQGTGGTTGEKQKKQCFGIFDWFLRQLREPEAH